MSKNDLDLTIKKVSIIAKGIEIHAEGYTADDINSMIGTTLGYEARREPENLQPISEKHIAPVKYVRREDDVEEYNIKEVMKGVKLPRVTTDFMCTGCEQSLIFINEADDTFLVRNLKDNTLHRTEAVIDSIPEGLCKDGVINYDIAIDIYNDMIKYASDENLTLVSDSEDVISCPFCHTKMTIKEAVKKFEEMSNEEKCPVCGGQIERTISQDGEKIVCKEHDCLSKIKKL